MASPDDPDRADFPDAVTERGRKHLGELAQRAKAGDRAVQFFAVNRTDRSSCGIASGIDPAYASALREAMAAGVEVLCYRADLSPTAATVGTRCPFVIPNTT
jgi:sugar fermentation stimulation protein A